MTLPPLCTNSYSTEDTVTHWLKRAFQTSDGQHTQYEKRAKARDANRTFRLTIAKAFGKKSNAEIAASPDATTLVAGTEVSIVLDLVPESQQHPHPCVQPAEIDVLRYPALRMLERLGIYLYWQDSTGQTKRMWYSQPFDSTTKPAFTVLQFLDIAEGLCQDPFQWPPDFYPTTLVAERGVVPNKNTETNTEIDTTISIELKPMHLRRSTNNHQPMDLTKQEICHEFERVTGLPSDLLADLGINIDIVKDGARYRRTADGRQIASLCDRCLLAKVPQCTADGEVTKFSYQTSICKPADSGEGCARCAVNGMMCTFVHRYPVDLPGCTRIPLSMATVPPEHARER